MLQSFLSQNKGSLLTHLNMDPLMPSQHQFNKPCCDLLSNKHVAIPQNQGMLPKSPTYKRRKIFEPNAVLQSIETAAFKEVDLTQSTVQTYRVPVAQQKTHEINLAKKKIKTNKQNGLYLAHGKLQYKQSPGSTLESIPSADQIVVNNTSAKNRSSSKNLNALAQNTNNIRLQNQYQNQESECSLSVRQGQPDLFTFKSEGTICFQYSQSRDANSSKSQSLLRVGSPRNPRSKIAM